MNIIKILLSLVRIIEGSDDRGSDNRGSTVIQSFFVMITLAKKAKFMHCVGTTPTILTVPRPLL